MIPPIYCVTQAEEPWKKIRITEHLKTRGLSCIIVDGVNGMNLGLKSMNPFDYDENGKEKFVHHSQIGKAISHRIALGAALSSGAPQFFVIEDDAILDEHFKDKWEQLAPAIPPDAAIIQIQYLSAHIKLNKVNEWFSRAQPYPFCSSAIWWSRDGAAKAVQTFWAFDRPFDIMLIQRVYPYLPHYVISKPIATRTSDA